MAGLHCSRIIPLEDVAFRSLEKQAESYKHSEDALLQRTGHKSKTRAYRNAIWCDISRGEGEIVFLPFRAAGRGTWKMLPEDECVIIPDTTDPEKLGSALWLAFNRGRDFEL